MLARFWSRLTLVMRMMFSAGFALIVAGILLLYVSTSQDAEYARIEISEDLGKELESLLPAISEWAVIGDYANIEQTLKQRAKHDEINHVTWVNSKSRTIDVASAQKPPQAPAWFIRWIAIPDQQATRTLSIGGRNYGSVTLVFSASVKIEHLWASFLSHLNILVLAVVLDFIGILLILKHSLRPLAALGKGAEALADGQLSTRIPLHGSPELRHIVSAFNRMASAVETAQTDLRQEAERMSITLASVSELKAQEARLEHMAHYDPLTGLPNRALLTDRMKVALAQAERSGEKLAICYLDLDGFKPINDTHGHAMGDRLLAEVATRLNAAVRGGDTVARLGGDEFVLLLAGLADVEECEGTLTRVLHAVSQPVPVDGERLLVTASIGATIFPGDGSDSDTLMRHADQAMYAAKESGRNRYHLFDPQHDHTVRRRRELLNRVETALHNEEFCLYYQPKVDMCAGVVVGVEALIRWRHPERGILLPGEFLPMLEDAELEIRIGEWVITEALRQMATWRAAGLDMRVSVNIAAHHLACINFAERMKEMLDRYPDVAKNRLELEVLESAAIEDVAHVSGLIKACQRIGVSFALDDFGTGYSSLTYLKRLPAETLKIDQSFVCDMLTDVEDMAIIEGIIGLAEAFHRSVIAEGVETAAHGRMLLHLGCFLGQGHGIARPMPAAELPPWIAAWQPDPSWKST